MDYQFLTVPEFLALEQSGTLLEVGTYEGKVIFVNMYIYTVYAQAYCTCVGLYLPKPICDCVPHSAGLGNGYNI